MRLHLPLTSTLLAATLFTAALPAVAQTHFCMGGDLDHLSPAEMTTCRAKMTGVREAVRHRGAPNGWRFLVVCDEGSWRDVAALTGRSAAHLQTVDFDTDRDMQVTFLRGSRMADGSSESAGRMLNAALEGVPGRYTRPGIGVTPAPIPNVTPVREQPTLLLAEADSPVRGADEPVSGQ